MLEFGELPGGDMKGGNFVRPAIVVNPKLNLRVVTEEQFGPVIPVIPFETEEEAIGGERQLGGLAVRSGRPIPRPPIASAVRWSAVMSGSTTTAPRAWICARPLAA